jgi:hypothetical protein
LSQCEAGYMILNLQVESLMKFEHNVGSLKIASTLDEFMKLINILINASTTLEELRSFKFGP